MRNEITWLILYILTHRILDYSISQTYLLQDHMRAPYEILGRVLDWVWVVAFLADTVFKGTAYNLTGKDFLDFPLVFAVDLNWKVGVIL